VSADWFRTHLLDDLMPRWLASSRTDNGLFRVDLDREWRPVGEHTATLVSQSRLIYNFATAYRHSSAPDYLSAASDLAGALLAHFRAHAAGAWRWAVTGQGQPADDHLSAYGHAFVIFGLSHACAVTANAKYGDAASETLAFVREAMHDGHGGFVAALRPDGTVAEGVRTQNPIMHLFEALLALGCDVGSPQARECAARVGEWVCARLIRSDGALPELFTPDWKPLPTSDRGRIDIGHQFEWAFLLSRAVELGLWTGSDADRALAAGHRLLEAGIRLGYDDDDGGVWSPASPEGELLSRAKGWWEQCEAARALLHYARVRGRTDLAPRFEDTMAFCRRHLIDPEHGGWYMRVEPDGSIQNTDKGNVWKVDYHVVGLCAEAMRLLGA